MTSVIEQTPLLETTPLDDQQQGSRVRVVCPSCSMEASVSDNRSLRPIADDASLRRCRNCQAIIDVSSRSPMIAEPLASA